MVEPIDDLLQGWVYATVAAGRRVVFIGEEPPEGVREGCRDGDQSLEARFELPGFVTGDGQPSEVDSLS